MAMDQVGRQMSRDSYTGRDFVGATPYVATLLVLSLSAQRPRMPKADGMRYGKCQGKRR
ncbi:hypothetical protein [Streptomyces sp. NBC_01431]|uniref:hypothetical protein n=1 Tax=Streptomyces sp. NBC_01431 TaxID=2903863 RepID=UPI002E31E44B|nr:hypothetical protein [Streptomyces sp. NBC_01431]